MEMEQGNLGVQRTHSGQGGEVRLSQHPCNFCSASFTSELGLIVHFRGEHYFNREGKVDDPFLSSDESDNEDIEDEAGVTRSIKRKPGGGILASGGDADGTEDSEPEWEGTGPGELNFLTDCERAHLAAEAAFDPYLEVEEEDDGDDDLEADSEPPEAEISWEVVVEPEHEDYEFWRGLPSFEKTGGGASHGEAPEAELPVQPPAPLTSTTSTPGGRPQFRLRSLPPEKVRPPTPKRKKVTKAKKDEDKVKSKVITAPAKAKTPVSAKKRRGRPPTQDGGGRQFECIFCGKTYVQGQEYLFNAHLRSHTMERPYFCKLCDQSFALNNYLTKHIRKWHDGAATPYPIKSKVCPESLSTRRELPKKEVKSKSAKDKVPLLKRNSTSTPGGRRQFALRLLPSLQSPGKVATSPTPTEKVTTRAKKDEDQVKSKVITDPPRTTPIKGPRGRGNDPRFECIFCGKTYFREWPFHAHLRTHTMESPYFCKLCDASFGRADYLTNHVRNKHKTVKTLYKCQLCSFTFRTREKLRRHHSVVHVKPDSVFKCEYCDKMFATGQNKARHSRVHFKEMKRKCPHCPKEFDRSDNLQNHMRSFHNSGIPLICRHCQGEFPSRYALGIHKRLMHSSESSKKR